MEQTALLLESPKFLPLLVLNDYPAQHQYFGAPWNTVTNTTSTSLTLNYETYTPGLTTAGIHLEPLDNYGESFHKNSGGWSLECMLCEGPGFALQHLVS